MHVLVGDNLAAIQINSTTVVIIIDPYFTRITDFMKCDDVPRCFLLCFVHATPEWGENGEISIITLGNVEILENIFTCE